MNAEIILAAFSGVFVGFVFGASLIGVTVAKADRDAEKEGIWKYGAHVYRLTRITGDQ